MIDNFSLLVSHGLVLILFWRLLKRDDLDREDTAPATPSTSDEENHRPPAAPSTAWRD